MSEERSSMFSAFQKPKAAPEPASPAPAAPEPAVPVAAEPDQSSRIAELEKRLGAEEERTASLTAALRESEEKIAAVASRPAKEDPRLEELESRLRAEEERTAALAAELEALREGPLELAPRTEEEDPRLAELEKRLSAEKERTGALPETLRDEVLRMASSCFDSAVAEFARKRYAQAAHALAASRKLCKLSSPLAEQDRGHGVSS